MRTQFISLFLVTQLVLQSLALGAAEEIELPVYPNQENQAQIQATLGDLEQGNPQGRAPENIALQNDGTKKILIKVGASVACFAAAGACAYGCYVASVDANHYWTQVNNAEVPAQGMSGQIRDLCRSSGAWQLACLSTDSAACQNRDRYQTFGDPYDVVEWEIGNCGEWQNLQDNEYYSYQVCGPVCTTNSHGVSVCATQCQTQTRLISSRSLDYLFVQCLNWGDYQKFLNSPNYQNCKAITGTNLAPAGEYTTAAVVAAVGSAGFIVCGSLAAAWL